MKRILITLVLGCLIVAPLAAAKKKQAKPQTDREYWCEQAYKMAQPVLENMAKGELQKNMQTEFSPSFDKRDRRVAYMETFGRLMAGIAPWLALQDEAAATAADQKEQTMRKQLREWALASYKDAVDPQESRLSAVAQGGTDAGGCRLLGRELYPWL